ncbi:MAG: serine/threonine-protein kinase [Gemmatimonadota bacterium]|nr:serine/threonine-protein kinase [Gemmatimonadota bacterium]
MTSTTAPSGRPRSERPLRATGDVNRLSYALPEHLAEWQLPPGWNWGSEGLWHQHRHLQEVIDALGRSLSLVTAPAPSHAAWLEAEARVLAHRNHPAVPTTYHYWTSFSENRRGPGYLRRWIAGETVGARLSRAGPEEVPSVLRVMREIGSTLSYLHDAGSVHGALTVDNVWTTPMGRLWLLGWQWAVPINDIPSGLSPDATGMPIPPEWNDGWIPTPASDQWQLGALCFHALTGEAPPATDIPPVALVRPDVPLSVSHVIDRALQPDPATRFNSVGAMVRAMDRVLGSRTVLNLSGETTAASRESPEVRLRWALADDYEVLAPLGAGTFGSVWRVRDLSLGREVALKLLHQHVARDERAVGRFRREARLAAQLAHPSIVPIYDWDSRGDVAWYTMELAEGGSVADLVERAGARALAEIAPQIDSVLSGLAAAHAIGIVHRDLKPENILIDRYRRWRIADFGIANRAGEELAGSSGTPAFSPPEQLLGEPQEAAADCFSLAAIAAYVLTGAPPFGESDSKVILARVLAGQVDVSGFAPEIAAWLQRGLAPRADDRFADATEMQEQWRIAAGAVLERERRVPWWKRIFGSEEGVESWWREDTVVAE